MAKATSKTKSQKRKKASSTRSSRKKTKSKSASRAVKAKTEGLETASRPGQETSAQRKAPAKPAPKRPTLVPRTYFAKMGQTDPKWKLVDAAGQTLGRLATRVATILMGKDKPTYTRHAATGDFVIVVNAEKVRLTGNKLSEKVYYWHTHYAGGIKQMTASTMLEKHPERVIKRAVYGMLPRGHVGRKWYKRLHVFAGPDHPHKAQKPEPVTLAG